MGVIRLCEAMQALPRAGGLLDQDSLFIFYLQEVKDADRVRQETDDKLRENSTP